MRREEIEGASLIRAQRSNTGAVTFRYPPSAGPVTREIIIRKPDTIVAEIQCANAADLGGELLDEALLEISNRGPNYDPWMVMSDPTLRLLAREWARPNPRKIIHRDRYPHETGVRPRGPFGPFVYIHPPVYGPVEIAVSDAAPDGAIWIGSARTDYYRRPALAWGEAYTGFRYTDIPGVKVMEERGIFTDETSGRARADAWLEG